MVTVHKNVSSKLQVSHGIQLHESHATHQSTGLVSTLLHKGHTKPPALTLNVGLGRKSRGAESSNLAPWWTNGANVCASPCIYSFS